MISVLRLGHRPQRDARISTHCGLVARALGASEIIYSGDDDQKLVESVRSVVKNWGGPFKVSYEKSWRKVVTEYKRKHFTVCHLTMYGLPIEKQIRKIRKYRNILVIIGAEKVPGAVYHSADYNIAVTNQPHSEVASLAIMLHEYFRGKELGRKFKGAKIKVIPQERGKRVVSKKH